MLTPFTSTEKNKQIKISISLSHPPSIAIPVLSSRLSLDQSSSRSSFYWYIDPTHHLFPWYPIRDCFFTKIKFCFRFPKIFEGSAGRGPRRHTNSCHNYQTHYWSKYPVTPTTAGQTRRKVTKALASGRRKLHQCPASTGSRGLVCGRTVDPRAQVAIRHALKTSLPEMQGE